jgi:hypothetical protein
MKHYLLIIEREILICGREEQNKITLLPLFSRIITFKLSVKTLSTTWSNIFNILFIFEL